MIASEDLQSFIGDAQEHLDSIEHGLLTLEHGVDQPPDVALINELFRAAHSIKGAAGTLGIQAVAALTHHLENLLHAIRSGKHPVSQDAIEVLFDGFDRLGTQIAALAAGQEPFAGNADLFARVEEMLEGPLSETFRPQDLLAVGVGSDWWPLISRKAGQALLNAQRDRRYIYRLRLFLAACRRSEEGALCHPLLERLELFAVPAARRHEAAPDDEVFDHAVEVLILSSAEPELVPILLGTPPADLEEVFVPSPETEPLPWQEGFLLLVAIQEAIARGWQAGHYQTEVPILKDSLAELGKWIPANLREHRLLTDFVPILVAPAPPEHVRAVLTSMFSQLLEAIYAHAQAAAEIVHLADGAEASGILSRLEEAWERGGRRFIVECSALQHLKGAEIESLVAWSQRLRAAGGGLCLAHQGPRRPWVMSLLEILGMSHELPLCLTPSEGLLAFGRTEENNR